MGGITIGIVPNPLFLVQIAIFPKVQNHIVFVFFFMLEHTNQILS